MASFKINVTSFDAHLAKNKAHVEQLVTAACIALLSEIAENIVVGGEFSPGTPVRTGAARGSWFLAFNADAVGGGGADPTGMGTLSAISAQALRVKPGMTVYLVSNLVYIYALEYGSSTQAPQGFIRLTAASAHAIAKKVAKQLKGRASISATGSFT